MADSKDKEIKFYYDSCDSSCGNSNTVPKKGYYFKPTPKLGLMGKYGQSKAKEITDESKSSKIKLVKHKNIEENTNPLTNIIVCVRNGTSYDPAFEMIPTNIPNGKAETYIIDYEGVNLLYKLFSGTTNDSDTLVDFYNDGKQLYEKIKSIPPTDSVFYWECCSGCSRGGGCNMKIEKYSVGNTSINLIHHLVCKEGIMVMCADFSLKGLISDWNSELLGPLPFKNICSTSEPFTLLFEPESLIQCKSTQLQNVGKLSENGKAVIKAMGGTIQYTVTDVDNSPYTIDILTVVQPGIDVFDSNLCQTTDKKHKGYAGQVILTYPNGGMLLVSNGHFSELARLDTSMEKFLQVVSAEYGANTSSTYSTQLNTMNDIDRQKFIQRKVSEMVAADVPCQRVSSNSLKGKYTTNIL